MEMTTTRYELRLIAPFNEAPQWQVGHILAVRKTPILRKEEWIQQWKGSALRFIVPREVIGLFKVTRTVTETEEML